MTPDLSPQATASRPTVGGGCDAAAMTVSTPTPIPLGFCSPCLAAGAITPAVAIDGGSGCCVEHVLQRAHVHLADTRQFLRDADEELRTAAVDGLVN